jgi:hypothetical protein
LPEPRKPPNGTMMGRVFISPEAESMPNVVCFANLG